MAVIKFNDVWEMFKIKFVIEGKPLLENFWALRGVSFEIEKGEILGIIGENGSGKSTILKLIAGMLSPDRGELKVFGRVSGLLELGAGFQMELTGLENIYLSSRLFGLTTNQIEKNISDIIDFASLGKFIHAPVKHYSSGMFVRLAFAIAIHMDPDILLIDDTLAVGDQYFQNKCIKKIFEIKEQDKTILFVTHDMHVLQRLCKRVIFLKGGRIIRDDTVEKVVSLSTQMIGESQGVFVLDKQPLGLVFNNGSLFISWLDTLLTPYPGLCLVFCIAGKWHSRLDAEWQVKKGDGDNFIAIGKSELFGVAQIWNVGVNSNGSISVDIGLEIDGIIEIQECRLECSAGQEYKYWFSDFGSGEFPAGFSGNVSDMLQRCIPDGVVGVSSEDDKFPSLSLSFLKGSNIFAKIFNSDFHSKVRMLHISRVEAEGCERFMPGKYNIFHLDLDLGASQAKKIAVQDNILQKEKLRFIFDNGRGRIYWDGVELTKNLALYTSVRSTGRWHDSFTSASWTIERKADGIIVAEGKWMHLPFKQFWEVRLKGDNTLELEVRLSVTEKVVVDRFQTNLMAAERYARWESVCAEGAIPVFKEDIGDDWDCVHVDGDSSFLRLKALSESERLPAVGFHCDKTYATGILCVVNSDVCHRGRMLQYLNKGEIKLAPGEYPYFKGQIDIGR